MDKLPILVGTHLTKGLEVYRVFENFEVSRRNGIITVNYSEYLLSNNIKIEIKNPLHYIVKNLKTGDNVNDIVMLEDFNGFDNWFNFDAGVLPDGTTLAAIIEGAIDATLAAIPIDSPNGFIITQSA